MKVVGSLRHRFPLEGLLAYVGLARSTYYYRASHPHTDRFAGERRLIRLILDEAGDAYGYRRVTLALERCYGIHLDRKTVARIMHAKGRRERGYSSYRGTVGKIAPNILEPAFTAGEPMEKLVGDVTQFNVGDARIYLSPLIDLFAGEVVSWGSAATRIGIRARHARRCRGQARGHGLHPIYVEEGQLPGQRLRRELLRKAGDGVLRRIRIHPARPVHARPRQMDRLVR